MKKVLNCLVPFLLPLTAPYASAAPLNSTCEAGYTEEILYVQNTRSGTIVKMHAKKDTVLAEFDAIPETRAQIDVENMKMNGAGGNELPPTDYVKVSPNGEVLYVTRPNDNDVIAMS